MMMMVRPTTVTTTDVAALSINSATNNEAIIALTSQNPQQNEQAAQLPTSEQQQQIQEQRVEEHTTIQEFGGILVPSQAFDPLVYWHLLELHLGIACPQINPECLIQRNHPRSKRHGSYDENRKRVGGVSGGNESNNNKIAFSRQQFVLNDDINSSNQNNKSFSAASSFNNNASQNAHQKEESKFLSLHTAISLWHESEVQEYHLSPVIQSATGLQTHLLLDQQNNFDDDLIGDGRIINGQLYNNIKKKKTLSMNRDPWDLIFIPSSSSAGSSVRVEKNGNNNNDVAEFGQFVVRNE